MKKEKKELTINIIATHQACIIWAAYVFKNAISLNIYNVFLLYAIPGIPLALLAYINGERCKKFREKYFKPVK